MNSPNIAVQLGNGQRATEAKARGNLCRHVGVALYARLACCRKAEASDRARETAVKTR